MNRLTSAKVELARAQENFFRSQNEKTSHELAVAQNEFAQAKIAAKKNVTI